VTLLLLAGLAIPASALATSTQPSAGTEATEELGGAHCGELSLDQGEPGGGCWLHLMSQRPVLLRVHAFGIESAQAECASEFETRIDEDNASYVYAQRLTGSPTGQCPRNACDGANAIAVPWRAIVIGDVGYRGFRESHRLPLCMVPTVATSEAPLCSVATPFRAGPFAHQYEYGSPVAVMPGVGPAGTRCEVRGRWLGEVEAASYATGLEIVNTDDL
jgi:hypothetical protein